MKLLLLKTQLLLVDTVAVATARKQFWDARTLNLKFAISHTNTYVTSASRPRTGPFLLTASGNYVKVIKIALLEEYEKRFPVLLAYLRFAAIVDESEEVEDVRLKILNIQGGILTTLSRVGCCSAP